MSEVCVGNVVKTFNGTFSTPVTNIHLIPDSLRLYEYFVLVS